LPLLGALENEIADLFERAVPAVVFVSNGEGFGSGFFVTDRGSVVTNAHVVGKAKQVSVVLRSREKLSCEVKRAEDATDLALLECPVRATVPVLSLESAPTRVGTFAAAIGHGEGGIWSYNVGWVTNVYSTQGNMAVLQTQIPLNPGNSGGPVLNRHGHVIGIATSMIKDSNNINFAIRSDMIVRTFPGLAPTGPWLVLRAPTKAAIFLDGAPVGEGPIVVVPATARRYEAFSVHAGKMTRRTFEYPENFEVILGEDPPAPRPVRKAPTNSIRPKD